MTKEYVLAGYDSDPYCPRWQIEGIFSSEEKAVAARDSRRWTEHYDIEEWPLDPVLFEPPKTPFMK